MLMKKYSLYTILVPVLSVFFMTGCYKLQKDYDYKPQEIDPHYNMTVRQFILQKGTAAANNDTSLKWMQKAIEYAGIDMAEYEKPNRTFILLHTDAIRRLTSGKVSGGFFFDYPVIVKDGSGNPIKSILVPALDSTRPALEWTDYSKETVKNLLLYFIIEGDYGFNNLPITNTAVKTLLPAGTTVDPKDSKLGSVVTKTTPNPDPSQIASVTFTTGSGTGFDPEGKMNLRIGNNDASPIIMNDRSWDRTAGFYFTNGQAHVFTSTSSSAPTSGIHPFRYSW
jgi:hypothetical protein